MASEILFVYDFDLLVDYLSGKPVDRDVHPVMLFAFDEEAGQSRSVRRIAPTLGYYVNHQVPCPRLTRFPRAHAIDSRYIGVGPGVG